MRIKKGVSIQGLKPEIVIALQIAENILDSYEQDCVITSGTDSKHSKKSRHYIGYAVDLRSRDCTNPVECAKSLQSALGSEYYCAFETDHFHIQFDGSVRG
jgi:hypothetical protein